MPRNRRQVRYPENVTVALTQDAASALGRCADKDNVPRAVLARKWIEDRIMWENKADHEAGAVWIPPPGRFKITLDISEELASAIFDLSRDAFDDVFTHEELAVKFIKEGIDRVNEVMRLQAFAAANLRRGFERGDHGWIRHEKRRSDPDALAAPDGEFEGLLPD